MRGLIFVGTCVKRPVTIRVYFSGCKVTMLVVMYGGPLMLMLWKRLLNIIPQISQIYTQELMVVYSRHNSSCIYPR